MCIRDSLTRATAIPIGELRQWGQRNPELFAAVYYYNPGLREEFTIMQVKADDATVATAFAELSRDGRTPCIEQVTFNQREKRQAVNQARALRDLDLGVVGVFSGLYEVEVWVLVIDIETVEEIRSRLQHPHLTIINGTALVLG